MDSTTKLALAIALSAAFLLFGFISYREFERQRDIAAAQVFLATIGQQSDRVAVQYQQAVLADQQHVAESQQRQREAVALSWDRRLLHDNQRCVGGVVIVQNGSSFTQLGTVGDPVRCVGDYADRELR